MHASQQTLAQSDSNQQLLCSFLTAEGLSASKNFQSKFQKMAAHNQMLDSRSKNNITTAEKEI